MNPTLDDNAALVQLRARFAQPPSRDVWEAICACFDALAPGGEGVALAYAQEHLERWPDALRRSPSAWLARIADGALIPEGWPLVRHLWRVGAPLRVAQQRALRRILPRVDVGLLSAVTLDEGALASGDLDALVDARRAWAGLTEVSLSMCDLRADAMTRLLTAPALARVQRLRFEGNVWDDHAPWSDDVPGADGALDLDLGACAMGEAGVRVLGMSRWMRRVGALRAPRNRLGEGRATLELWSQSPAMVHLHTLDVAFNDLNTPALAPLLSAPPAALRALRLTHNPIDAVCLRVFSSGPLVNTLEALDVSLCDLNDEAARTLGGARWATLRSLELSGNALTNDALAPLLRGPLGTTVRDLNLAGNDLGPSAPEALLHPDRLPRLEALDLRYNRLDDNARHTLSDAWSDAPAQLTL